MLFYGNEFLRSFTAFSASQVLRNFYDNQHRDLSTIEHEWDELEGTIVEGKRNCETEISFLKYRKGSSAGVIYELNWLKNYQVSHIHFSTSIRSDRIIKLHRRSISPIQMKLPSYQEISEELSLGEKNPNVPIDNRRNSQFYLKSRLQKNCIRHSSISIVTFADFLVGRASAAPRLAVFSFIEESIKVYRRGRRKTESRKGKRGCP